MLGELAQSTPSITRMELYYKDYKKAREHVFVIIHFYLQYCNSRGSVFFSNSELS